MAYDNNDDFIYGRLHNELKQIEEQKRRAAERKKQSESNWFAEWIRMIGQKLGKAISYTFEQLGNLIEKIFGK